MAFIEWDKSLETGIEVVDAQHKRLIGFVNELHEAMMQRKGKEAMGHVLSELERYTVYHFGVEEKAFARFAYPAAAEHAGHHRELVAKIAELAARHGRGEMAVSVQTLDFLNAWVNDHIRAEDMLYVPFLKGKPIE